MSERRDFLKIASFFPFMAKEPQAKSTAPQQPQTTTSPSEADGSWAATSTNAPPPIPNAPEVQERRFPDYHLLGKPDPAGNLFGTDRPKDWQKTKDQLIHELLHVADPQDPVHEWVSAFRLSFDERAASIVVAADGTLLRVAGQTELRYEPQLFDSSLEAASTLLDRCLRYRSEMGASESSGVDAAIGYLSFLKIRPLQRNLLILSNSADLEEIDKITQANAQDNYQKSAGMDKLFERVHLRGLQIQAQGDSVEAGLAEAKDRLSTRLLERQFHIQTDAELAQFACAFSGGSSSNFAERYLRTHALLMEDLADAYRKLYSASKGVQQVLGIRQITPGVGPSVSADIPRFANADSLRKWVQQIIPAQEGEERKPDILDALVVWTRAVLRELDIRNQFETEFTVSIPLNQPWGQKNAVILRPGEISAAFNSARGNPSGTVSFDLAPDALPFSNPPRSIRIVGVGLAIEHDATAAGSSEPEPNDAQRAKVRKMARLNANVGTPPQTVTGIGTYTRPRLFLSNVRVQGGMSGDFEPVLSFDPGCRNLWPFGTWTISIDPNVLEFFQSSAQLTDNWVSGLILHLRLRGTSL